jgi:cobalt-zinc-cadmium efflux system membrane fusion protein
MKYLFFVLALALGCESPPAELTPEAEPEPAAASTGAARWAAVQRPSDATLLEHPAVVVGDPGTNSELGASFRARVQAVHVRVGQHVEAGAPVLDVIVPEVLSAAASVRGTSARIAAHRARAAELERLLADGLVDASRVFEQRAIVAELEAERAHALSTLQAASVPPNEAARLLSRGTITLRAPSAGTVRTLDARLGETREPGSAPFARIVGAGDARIEVRSTEPLPAGAVRFQAADGTTVPLAPEPLAHLVDPADGTHVTWFGTAEPAQLIDGLRGRVRLALPATDVWEVPTSALTLGERGDATLQRRAGEAVQPVSVTVVARSGATSIVRGPLSEGDEVAANPEALTQADEG